MPTANFVLPFAHGITTCPAPEWVHLGRETDKGTVMVQVRGDEATIAAMKSDPTYTWLEDVPESVVEVESKPPEDEKPPEEEKPVEGEPVEEKPAEPVEVAPVAKAEPVDLKAAMVEKFTKTAVDKLAWSTAEYAIKSVCKLHGTTIEDYKAGGLG
jgi:hypothetical protein